MNRYRMLKKAILFLMACSLAVGSLSVSAAVVRAENDINADPEYALIDEMSEDAEVIIDEASEIPDEQAEETDALPEQVETVEVQEIEDIEAEEELQVEVIDEQATVTSNSGGAVDMYRMYNPNSGEHFYTGSVAERDNLLLVGWNYEGIGWTAPESSGTPVYRLYNPNAGDHHYTTSSVERDHLVSVGWNDEGIGWYSDDNETLPLLRQYNPNAVTGAHNFTLSQGENNNLVRLGWREEGIAWYGMPDPDPKPSNPVYIQRMIDFSSVYDFWYYIENNPDLKAQFGYDDARALDHFVQYGIDEGRAGKENFSQSDLDAIKEKLAPPKPEPVILDGIGQKAQSYSSSTDYLIMISKGNYAVRVFRGSKGNWNQVQAFPCAIGKPSTPTPVGTFKVDYKKYFFDSGSVRVFYATHFAWRGYYMHSVLYRKTSTPQTVADGRVGAMLSHGCVRLPLDAAQWIYNNVPIGTTVVVY